MPAVWHENKGNLVMLFHHRGVLVSVVGRSVGKPPERGRHGRPRPVSVLGQPVSRVQAPPEPPSGGHGCPCARLLEAAVTCRSRAGARVGWLVRVRCTSGRSASAACGVRGVRAAPQQSK